MKEKENTLKFSLGMLSLFLVLASAVALIAVIGRKLDQPHFVIKVTNNRSATIVDAKLSGLGRSGSFGSLRSGESKQATFRGRTLREHINFDWDNGTGGRVSLGRPNDWNAGMNVEGVFFEVVLENGSCGVSKSDMSLLQKLVIW